MKHADIILIVDQNGHKSFKVCPYSQLNSLLEEHDVVLLNQHSVHLRPKKKDNFQIDLVQQLNNLNTSVSDLRNDFKELKNFFQNFLQQFISASLSQQKNITLNSSSDKVVSHGSKKIGKLQIFAVRLDSPDIHKSFENDLQKILNQRLSQSVVQVNVKNVSITEISSLAQSSPSSSSILLFLSFPITTRLPENSISTFIEIKSSNIIYSTIFFNERK